MRLTWYQGKLSHSTWKLMGAAVLILWSVTIVALNVVLVLMGDTLHSVIDSDVIEVNKEQVEALREQGHQLAQEIQGESLVLLENHHQTLPFSADTTKVNVFGWASTQWVVSGSGSGQVSGATEGILDALEAAGIATNTRLSSAYRAYMAQRSFASDGSLHSSDEQYGRLVEPSLTQLDRYTGLLEEAERFSDTALVVISRTSGESIDCPEYQYTYDPERRVVMVDPTRHYLQLSRTELELLEYTGKRYERVVVLVNSTNPMDLSELERIEGIDAVMLVGATGTSGTHAVVDALWGRINPSGKTADTYPYDFATAPQWVLSGRAGEGRYIAAEGMYPADGTLNENLKVAVPYDQVSYVDYREGIYVGYRWYETADAEGFWDNVDNEFGQGYAGVVQYPFGYGLSYTSFSWEVVGRSPGAYNTVGRDTTVEISVKVTNTGTQAGKDVVQLYASAPYTRGGIEKPATQLVDFAKTDLLQPQESQIVTLRCSLDDLASFDAEDRNHNGFRGYELEKGTYAFELKHDAHQVADIRYARTTYYIPKTILCDTNLATGQTVTTRFSDSDATGLATDYDLKRDEGRLSRADFAATMPKYVPERAYDQRLAAFNLYADEAYYQQFSQIDKEDLLESARMPARSSVPAVLRLYKNAQPTELGLVLGRDYENPTWENILDSLTIDDMQRLVLHGYLTTGTLESIGKPRTKEVDGPAQIGSFNQLKYGEGFASSSTQAQSWNKALLHRYGQFMGLSAAYLGVDGWYAPCANIHRSPLGGRNYEYYSEDPLLSGTYAGLVAQGARESGTYTFIKHFAVNNQDTYRDALYTWLDEQTLRELYLRPFERCVRLGATGFMTAYNRVGATWAGGSHDLLTEVLRGEWGFRGAVITDYCDHQRYMHADQALYAGGDLYMDGVFRNGAFAYTYAYKDLLPTAPADKRIHALYYVQALRRATKNILYMQLNARATNVDYNEQVPDEPLVRPEKYPGFNYVGATLAWINCATFVGVVLMVHAVKRKYEERSRASTEG